MRVAKTSIAMLMALAAIGDAKPIVHPGVHRSLRSQATVNLILTMKDGVSTALSGSLAAESSSSSSSSKGDKITSLVESLELHANSTQKEVTKVLAQESDAATFASARSFWVSNQVYIEAATVSLLTKLITLSSVYEIREELVVPLPTLGEITAIDTTATSTAEWGVTKIDAPTVWDLGNTGEGVVISHIDTGVRSTHEALAANFRSNYGWYDPEKEAATPYDSYGHGTHTMGTMVGSGGIGVAPGATWITCKGCRSNSCYESDLLACAEFITCPHNTTGGDKDCSLAPDIVGNSWGGGQGDTFYADAIQTWLAAGIAPVFSIGNNGPECGTANSPGDDASIIAVGATTSADALASYSSKGAAVTGGIKPDVSAPGSSVRSSYYLSDTSYATGSGTSMACPHVSGTLALLLSANSSLSYGDLKTVLFASTERNLTASGYTCNGTSDTDVPNNQYGYGRISALTAVLSV